MTTHLFFRFVISAAMLVLAQSPAAAQSCQEWRLRATSGPSPRGEFRLAFDSRRGMTVLVGGAQNLGFDSVFRETWEWDGQAWTLVSTGGPTQRCDNAVSYDSTREVVVSFGGYDGTFLRNTWAWNGATWQQKSSTGPAARADAAMAFDQTDGAMILLGGLAGATVAQDTWRWNGTAWATLAPATVPPARWIHRMAYDAVRDEMVVFGGAGTVAVLGDMWTWNGSNWTARTPGTLPPARYGNALAYDSHRHPRLPGGPARPPAVREDPPFDHRQPQESEGASPLVRRRIRRRAPLRGGAGVEPALSEEARRHPRGLK